MDDRKKKILIITLVSITIFILIYILYMFWSRNRTDDGTGTSKNLLNFGNLISKKKPAKDGSEINTPADGITLPGTEGTTGTPSGNIPGGTTIPNTPNLTPLPGPGNSGSNYNPTNPIIITDVPIPKDPLNPCVPTKTKPCPGDGPGPNVTVINFSLNDEEQAELDRLNRMFARLAPYLKTEADIAREQSNQEAYEDFVVEANRLSRETDITVARTSYKGPREVKRPFLTSIEFGAVLQDQLILEVVGYSGGYYSLSILDLIGLTGFTSGVTNGINNGLNGIGNLLNINIGNLNTPQANGNQLEFTNKLGEKISKEIVVAVNRFVEKTTNNKLTGPCKKGDTVSGCSFLLFEVTLDIQ